MRILLVTQWFDPEPTLKGLSFARTLHQLGHEVEVLTGFPNYPGGRLYPGFRQKVVQVERHDGVRVIRVPLFPSHDDSGIRRALGYASFGLSSTAIGGWMVRKPDVIYAYHPPLTTALAASALGAIKRAPIVLDIQDLWPDTLAATGMVRSRSILSLVGTLCRVTFQWAARIVVLSPGFKEVLVARGVPPAKIDVIYNWTDEERLTVTRDPAMDRRFRGDARFNVVFAGTMGKAQGLGTVLDAAEGLRETMPQVRFILVGAGVDALSLAAEAHRRALENVEFLPALPMESIGSVLAVADALLVHLRDDPLFSITIPSKTQAYLAAGKPVIMAVDGDAADLVERSGAGVTCAPGDPLALATAVARLAGLSETERDAMGQRGTEFYTRELSLREGAARFASVLERAHGGVT